jgi:hypothetical protein
MASNPNLQAHLGAVAELSCDKEKPHAVGAAVLPVTGNQQVWTDVRPRSPLARSAGPLAIPTLSGGRWMQVAYFIADLSSLPAENGHPRGITLAFCQRRHVSNQTIS